MMREEGEETMREVGRPTDRSSSRLRRDDDVDSSFYGRWGVQDLFDGKGSDATHKYSVGRLFS